MTSREQTLTEGVRSRQRNPQPPVFHMNPPGKVFWMLFSHFQGNIAPNAQRGNHRNIFCYFLPQALFAAIISLQLLKQSPYLGLSLGKKQTSKLHHQLGGCFHFLQLDLSQSVEIWGITNSPQ